MNMPGGSMDIGRQKYLVRTPAEYETPQEINNIVAFVRNGKPVYLRDIATIKDHYDDPETISRIDGVQSVTLQVKKRTGANIIQIIDTVKQVVAEMQAQLPPELKVDLTSDKSEDIRTMVADLENNILTGLVLVLAVVFAFIGGRSALFVALAIPMSMLITFILLKAFGITLNMVVLFSLTLALGMLVDNGIVIVENIYRHMQEGKSRLEAARRGRGRGGLAGHHLHPDHGGRLLPHDCSGRASWASSWSTCPRPSSWPCSPPCSWPWSSTRCCRPATRRPRHRARPRASLRSAAWSAAWSWSTSGP